MDANHLLASLDGLLGAGNVFSFLLLHLLLLICPSDSSHQLFVCRGLGDGQVFLQHSCGLVELVDRGTAGILHVLHELLDMTEMKQNLAKLRGLSMDDKTENGMLRSRIDEQSQLIGILKQRADEETISRQTLEKMNKELENFREHAEDELNMQLKKCNMLDARFHDLASNHEELIKIKDDYKFRNAELMRENAKLREENERLFSKAMEEKDQKITQMGMQIARLTDHSASLESRCRELQKTVEEKEERYQVELKDLTKRLADAEERLKGTTAKLQYHVNSQQSSNVDAQNKLSQLTKEKEDLLQLTMSRGKIIQDKQTENKLLQQRVDDMEKRVRDMHAKFEREAAAVNMNLQVRKLRQELEEADEDREETAREFEAFKKHSNAMLHKERELNSKLRHLMG